MLFDLEKYYNNTAVVTETGLTLSYAQLELAADAVTEDMEPRKLTFCLCENTIGSFVGYVGFMTRNIPTVLLDGSKEIGVMLSLIDHYLPQYVWCPTKRVRELNRGSRVTEYEDYTLLKLEEQKYEIHPDVLLCLTTSGTTGSPKLVKLTERNLADYAR